MTAKTKTLRTATSSKQVPAGADTTTQTPDLLIACLAEPARLARLTPGQWDRILPQAREAQMLATLADVARAAGCANTIPAAAQRHLDGALLVAERRVAALLWEVERLRVELPELGAARPVLLKGVAYIVAGLPHAGARLCADIDLLVPRAEIDRVERMLGWAGWTHGQLDAYDERYYREWMHQLPPLQHMRRGSTLDLHHNILPDTARRPPDSGRLIRRAQPVAGDDRFATPAPAHMIIHAAVHLFADSEWDKAVRDFYDLDQLLRHFADREGAGLWDDLIAETEALRRGREVFYGLRYCRRWFATPVPPAVSDATWRWRPPWPLLAIMDQVFRHATAARADGPHPRLTSACRGFLFIRSHWVKMPPLLLVRHLFHKAFLSPAEDGG